MVAQRFSITLPSNVAEQLDARTLSDRDRSATIARGLERYYWLLQRGRRELSGLLSEQELSACLDALNGIGLFDSFAISYIGAEIQDAVKLEYLADKWQLDSQGFVIKIGSLTDIQSAALADAAERWWARIGAGEYLAAADALK